MDTLRSNNQHGPWWGRPNVVIPFLMAAALAISLFVFMHESLRLDESQSLWQTSHSPSRILAIVAEDVHVPFYHLLLHYWELLFGNTAEAGRALSLLFFLAGIPALYLLGLRAYENRTVALFAAALFALSPFMNWYGNEIRMYSLFALLAILSHYFFLGLAKRGDRFSFVAYGLTTLFGIFTHYFFFIVVFIQAVYFFWERRSFPEGTFRRLVMMGSFIFLAFAPWAAYVTKLGLGTNTSPLLPVPNSVNVFNALAEFFIGFQKDGLNAVIVSSWPLTVLVSFLTLRKHNRPPAESIYFLAAAFLPIILIYVASLVWKPLYVSRYLIFTAPALYLVVAWVIHTYARPVSFAFRSLILVVMVGTLGVQMFSGADTPVRENYRAATQYLNEHSAPNDVIIVSAPFTIYPVEYYYRGEASLKTLPDWNRNVIGPIPPFEEGKLPAEADKLTGGYRRVWVLLSYDQGYEEKIKRYFDTHYHLLEEENFSKDLNLYAYKLRYDNEGVLSSR
ncbi:glycosyltransferase family 39 protein [Candidatus Parcubacteria bacterium]|nr:glycosyltransferase family 39 protein [Candidatus Parcubacteria bacterium]